MAKTPAQLRREAANAVRRAERAMETSQRLAREARQEQHALNEAARGQRKTLSEMRNEIRRKARQNTLQRKRVSSATRKLVENFKAIIGNFGNDPQRFNSLVTQHEQKRKLHTDPYGMGWVSPLPPINLTAARRVYNHLIKQQAHAIHNAQLAAAQKAVNAAQRQLSRLTFSRPRR